VVIGILMLMGIVTKNAIMLVDFAVESEARGVSQTDAIIDAGHKRARPIVMTTIAMAAGMLPTALGYGDGGDAELQAELFEGFGAAMRNGLLMVYIVLAVLFSSMLHPLTILFSLPLSIAGAIAALLITSLPVTTPVVIGILMLMGIVTKNAIMLVDFAIEAIRQGMNRDAAIIDAGQKRARPIIMTTIAMVAGMIPSALSFGAGGEFRSPMALAVIGGLIFSTVLSLIFVPAMFSMMDDLSHVLWRFSKRFVSSGEEGEQAHGAPPKSAAH